MGISLNLIACAVLTVWMVEYFGYNNNLPFLLLTGIFLVVTRLVLLIPFKKRA